MTQSRFTDMPPRIARLPVDPRGFPIPWFVETLPDGTRDFRLASARNRIRAVKQKLCWICGDRLGRHLVFAIGPMCAVNRVTSEPPCHRDCALFAVRACPFMTQPLAQYNDSNFPVPDDEKTSSGLPIKRNPGVTCLWTTFTFSTFDAHPGWLISLGEPIVVQWFAHGRMATRPEVETSIRTGLPFLEETARAQGPEAVAELGRYVDRFNAMGIMPQ